MTASSKYDVNSGGGGNSTNLASTSGVTNVASATGITQCSQNSSTTGSLDLNSIGPPVMLQPNSPSSSSSTSKNNGDATFEPTVDMMVNDFDDEQTLEEEEALAAEEAEDPSAELSSLQKESDMPIEELLALYNCTGPEIVSPTYASTVNTAYKRGTNNDSVNSNNQRSNSKVAQNLSSGEPKMTKATTPNLKKSEICKENGLGDELEPEEFDEDEDDDIKETSQLRELYPETYGSTDKRLLRTISRQQSDEDEDGEYSPDEDEFKKTIMVGSEFQAVIPEGFFKYDDVLPYENEDKLLWDPSRISERETEEYLLDALKAKQQQQQNGSSHFFASVDSVPAGNHLRDDEQALYLLLQCGHNTEEALRRKRINAIPSSEQMSSWSEDECRNFESGIRIYGKDFHTIQNTKVRTRSVGELVQFYYLWKKTERHDIFANKARLEKKKYNLHPGLTDYMDRFLEEQEGGSNGNIVGSSAAAIGNFTLCDRSLSPGTQISHLNASIAASGSASSVMSLIQADNKRNNSSIPQGKHNASSMSVQTTESNLSDQPTLKDPLAIDDEEYKIGENRDLQGARSASTTESAPSAMLMEATISATSDTVVQRVVNQ